LWQTATHLPSKENTLADKESCVFHDNTEWMLHYTIFKKIKKISEVFLSGKHRLNAKLPKYISWKPDPGALFVDAFQLCQTELKCYAFPPFSVIDRVLQKTSDRQSSGDF
jgi:hypothetical protein